MTPEETYRSVRKAFDQYPELFVNLRATKSNDNRVVTWHGYEKIWVSRFPSREEFVRVVESGQYSFQVADGSIFQLYYQFNRNDLVKAGLAFMRLFEVVNDNIDVVDRITEPISVADLDDETRSDEASAPSVTNEESDDNFVVSWLRIDYDKENARGIAHPPCHLHLDGFPDLRFAVRGVPTPTQFVDLVVSLVYPDSYCEARLTVDGKMKDVVAYKDANRNRFPCDQEEMFELITHVRLPGVVT